VERSPGESRLCALDGLISSAFVNTEWDGEVSDKSKFLADIKDPAVQAHQPDDSGCEGQHVRATPL